MLNAAYARDASAARGLIQRFRWVDAADEVRDAREAMRAQVILDSRVHLHRRERVVEQRRAETDRRRSREHELERVVRRHDAALTDDRNAACLALLIDLVDLQQRDRPDRGSR